MIISAASAGCRRQRQPAPEQVYSEIEKTLVSGDLKKASDEAKTAYERSQNFETGWSTIFGVELGKVLIYVGRPADALAFLERPLLPNTSRDTATSRNIYLSIAQARLGRVQEAEQTLASEKQKGCSPSLRAELLGAEGALDVQKGDLPSAQDHFRSSLAAGRLANDLFQQTQASLNLGHVALLQEHYDSALERFSEASALARPLGAKLALEKAAGNSGWAYFKLGDFQRALEQEKIAESQARELGSIGDQVRWLNNAGLSESRLGNLAAARALYEQALALAEAASNSEDTLDAHVNLGDLLLQSGNLSESEAHVREASRLAALSKDPAVSLDPMLLQGLLLRAHGDRSAAAKVLLSLDTRAATQEPSLQWEAESDLGQIYLETGQTAEADRWFRRSIATFRRQRSSLSTVESTLPFLENATELYSRYVQFLIRQNRADEALRAIDESRADTLTDALSTDVPSSSLASPLDARRIAMRLKATLLVYSLQPGSSYLWVITPTRNQFFSLAGKEIIEPQIQLQTRLILQSKDLLTQPDAPARILYDELVKPAESLIAKGSKVFIMGDQALGSLNFETLVTPSNDPHYWIEDVTITNAKSLRLLSLKSGVVRRDADKRLLLMGDPVYHSDEFSALPNAAAEVRDVASHFAPEHRVLLTGLAASPDAYRSSEPGRFAYIHFVAHATANITTPLESAVVLSPNGSDPTAYKLYARDIINGNLQADLVTLSSCYGSGLRNYSGEGLVGLAWAFLHAGSHQVIGAMWEVSDASTPLLMDSLYFELAKGTAPDTALRSAKLQMLHSGGVFRKPLYWASFQLYSGA